MEYLSLWRGAVRPVCGINQTLRLNLPKSVVDRTIADVCERRGVTRDDIMGKCRSRRCSFPRQEVMFLLRSYKAADGRPAYSLPEIGRALGGLDHSTVKHGVTAHRVRAIVSDFVEAA